MFRQGCLCPLCGHMSVAARAHAHASHGSRSTLGSGRTGSCSTGDCSTVEVAHDSRIQPGPGGWPARSLAAADLTPGRPVVFRNATVLTMDDGAPRPARRRRPGRRRTDRRGRSEARGARRHRRDRRHRRHRHAGHDRHPPAHVADGDARLRRGLDAHPVLRLVLPAVGQGRSGPQDIYAGNLLSAIEALDAGVTTTRRLVPRPADVDHADAAVDALQAVPGPLRPGLRQHPAGPVGVVDRAGVPRLRRAAAFSGGDDMLGFQMAFDVPGNPDVPGAGRLRGGARPGCAGHHPRRGAGRHHRRRHPADVRERLHDPAHHLCARRHADAPTRTTASRRPAARCRCPPRASRAPARATRPPGGCASTAFPVSLSMDTSVWWSGDLFSAMRATLERRPCPRAPGGARAATRP